MRGLPAINLVAHLTTRVIDQNFALTALNKHDEVSHQTDQNHNQQSDDDAHGARANQLQQSTDGAGQSGCNAGEDDDGYTVTQATLCDLFAQPHQKHGASS